jgi:PAS domain S-box-containing protein
MTAPRFEDHKPAARLLYAIATATVLLGIVYLVLYVRWGPGPVLAQVPWYSPMIFTFLALTCLSVAFLTFGRCWVLRDRGSLWTGIGFLSFAMGITFHVLAWPGLLPDNRSIFAHSANTAALMSALAPGVLGISLLAAVVRPPGEPTVTSRRSLWLPAAWFLFVTFSFPLAIVFERRLPLLILEDGTFTLLLSAWNVVLLLLFGTGAGLSIRRGLSSGDVLPGYVAIFQVALVFTSLSILIGQHRYDPWWYLNRIVLVGGALLVLFGLLWEYVRLFRREQEKTDSLRDSQERFRTLSKVAFEGIAISEQGRIIEVNEALTGMTGYSRSELLTLHIWDLMAPEYRESVRQRGLTGSEEPYEVVVRRKDGRTFFAEARGRAFTYRGRPARVGVLTDISERRKAEEELRRYELLSAHTRDILLFLRRDDGRILEANAAAVKAYGYSREELLRLTIHDLRSPSTKEQTTGQMAEADAQGILFETVHRRKDGTLFPVEVSSQGAMIAGVYTLISVIRDITLRKQAEQALRESERWFRTLADAMPQLVWTARPDGQVDYYNERHKDYRGIERTAGGSFRWAPVLHEQDVAPTVQAWQHALRTGETYQIEHRVQRADGSYHWHLSRGMPVRDREGRIVKWFGTATDIDNVKRTEAALRELTATLESRVIERTAELERRTRQLQKLTLELSQAEERERKRLAGILHDDLQQQLAAAKFHLGLLGKQIKSDASLREATDQVEAMIKDAIAKSRSLSHELSPAMLYHGDFGETLEWLASQTQAKHGLMVHVEVHDPVEVSSDSIKAFLFRAAQEILFNTVKHAQVTEATVRLRQRRGRLTLGIFDHGRGFDPKSLGQTGGLGLVSIRERVELLGGRMKIRSAPGRGSTFLIAMPDGHAPAAEPSPTAKTDQPEGAEPHPPARSGRLRVLLADDHKVVREGIATLLNEQEDIEVVGQAANGREAVDLAHKLHPDVIVMDVTMPVMEGDEATRQIKRRMPWARVVGLSMFEEPAMVEKMRRAGAQSYVSKTAPAEKLLAAIREKQSICIYRPPST